jgi:hypothetical protein
MGASAPPPKPPSAPEVVIARLARINADVLPDDGPDDCRAADEG